MGGMRGRWRGGLVCGGGSGLSEPGYNGGGWRGGVIQLRSATKEGECRSGVRSGEWARQSEVRRAGKWGVAFQTAGRLF